MFEFWLYSYATSLFGSVSFGYFLLRYGMPDIRTLPRQIKLGLSGFAGMLIFLISAVISYFFLTPMFLYFLMPALTLVGIILIVLKNFFFSPKTIKIAVPVVKVSNPSKIKQELKAKKLTKPKEVFEKPIVLKSSDLNKKAKSKKLSAPEKVSEKKVASKAEEIKKKLEAASSARIKVENQVQQVKKENIEIEPERKAASNVHVGRESPYALHKRKRNEEPVEEQSTAGGVIPSKVEHLSRRERYLRRRGLLVEQAKADLTKPKALKGESAPLPIIPEEDVNLEFGEGLDLSDLDSADSLGELNDLASADDSIGELSGLDSLDEDTLGNLGGLSVEQEVKKEKGMTCPTCGAKNVKIIYCPYCGKGFCSNCSLKVQRKGDLIVYQCPNCKKEVIVKAEDAKKK